MGAIVFDGCLNIATIQFCSVRSISMIPDHLLDLFSSTTHNIAFVGPRWCGQKVSWIMTEKNQHAIGGI